MASPASLLKAILNVKEVVFLNADTQSVERTRFDDIYEETSFLFDVRPYKKSESICHLCGRVCPRFDQGNYEEARCWLVLIGGSQGLPSVQNPSRCLPFDFTITWLVSRLSKTDIVFYMGMTGRLLATAFAARSIRSNWIKTAILKRL